MLILRIIHNCMQLYENPWISMENSNFSLNTLKLFAFMNFYEEMLEKMDKSLEMQRKVKKHV